MESGHEFEQTTGDHEGRGRVRRVIHDLATEQQ